ncbi:glycine-rich protein DOT1 isoform X2 [Folsomia candida]|uniref:glycine-rich protein DOT1 isoform X2 n=1 Tax=Folsomia candida TaxID=158441 RepID=UPI000B8F62DF|nr:glycine-rich protein DOT1 isoform X2 [Folsomia candida]
MNIYNAVLLLISMFYVVFGSEIGKNESGAIRVKRGHGGGGGHGHGPGRGGGAAGPVYFCGYVGGKEGSRYGGGYGK